jgi:glyoxylate/hydroxypyruvate reductase A
MALLVKSDIERGDDWTVAFGRAMPELEVRNWPETGDVADIDYAFVWKPPPGALRSYPNLKVIFSMGAGIDHLTKDPELPRELPIVRMVEPGLTEGMSQFVVMAVLGQHRYLLDYAEQRRRKVWEELPQIAAADRRVGIMGLGALGGDAAAKLLPFGFDLAGWSRTRKDIPGVACFHGEAGFEPFLARSDILVCLLPATPATEGILCRRTFDLMPRGASVINVARGAHLVEPDLFEALDSGQLSGATLDVFAVEPPPPDSPVWTHPRIAMTPHIASMPIVQSAAQSVADNIRRHIAGEALLHTFDWEHGY